MKIIKNYPFEAGFVLYLCAAGNWVLRPCYRKTHYVNHGLENFVAVKFYVNAGVKPVFLNFKHIDT
jgi:hypothetical protein